MKHIISDKLKAELMIIDYSSSKANYADLGRRYGLDPRTVKKYHDGYKGKPKTRDKPSKLDKFYEEIVSKLSIKRIKKIGVYKFLINKYGYDEVGSYSNFKTYCRNKKLMPAKANDVAPRYETEPGDMAQVDWKEDITLTTKNGEKLVVNIFHIVLKFSRFSYIELTISKEQSIVLRCLVNSFIYFKGVPKRLLFDNMSTVSDVSGNTRKINIRIEQFAKDFNFDVQLCKPRHPKTKGTNEARNKILDQIRAYDKEIESYEDLIKISEKLNEQMNIDVCEGTNMAPYLLYYKEKEYLSPLPCIEIIDSYLAPTKVQVNKSQLISYKGHQYSLDSSFIDKYVQPEEFNGKLYLYYKGKCVGIHSISDKPINYIPEHYKQLLSKVSNSDKLEEYAKRNLDIMDKLMEKRKVLLTLQDAITSKEGLIAYLIQKSNNNGWITSYISSLSKADKDKFFIEMKKLLPFITNEEIFISNFKFVFKEYPIDECRLGFYLLENMNPESFISDEGYKNIGKEFETQINEIFTDLAFKARKDKVENGKPDFPLE